MELQIRRLAYWDKRSLFYLAKMYTDNLFVGQRYDRLKKCIVISILDFAGDEHPDYHKVYHLRDQEGRLYSDQFEVHIIELNKKLTGDKLDDWIRFFQVKSMGELNKLQSANVGVMEAVEEVKRMPSEKTAGMRVTPRGMQRGMRRVTFIEANRESWIYWRNWAMYRMIYAVTLIAHGIQRPCGNGLNLQHMQRVLMISVKR